MMAGSIMGNAHAITIFPAASIGLGASIGVTASAWAGPHLLRNRCDWPCAAVLGYAHSMTLELKAHPHMLCHAYGYALANKGLPLYLL
jgi:hypothetical protein